MNRKRVDGSDPRGALSLDAPRDPLAESLERWLRVECARRPMLRASASCMLLAGLGALLPAGCRSYPQPPVSLRFFTAEEYAVFQAIARAVLGLHDESVDVAAEVDALVDRMGRRVRRDIRWILRIFEHGTHFFDLKGRRFTRLARRDQESYLRGWMESSLGARRMVFRALKLMAALGYYGLPATWSEIGYDGPWIGRREEARLKSFEAAVPLESFSRT